ncbi:MAG: DNA-binding response regulator [Arcobacter sp.]|nr:MAG: DNA-binding response regulator [Arcobacter sp.]
MKTKILIVEDETIVALDMKKTLENLNFEITNTATNYNSAINSVRKNKPDVILMDINLKNSKDGIETTKKIHTIEKIPVIYLTACNDDDTINRAIETNPIAYLNKPFKIDDLKSNILLGIYKEKQKNDFFQNTSYISIGLDYYYNYDKYRLYYKKLPIKLSEKENLLLKLLINANGDIVSFEKLIGELWPSNIISNSTLRTLIYRLRGKLEHKLIETIPMIGCRLISKLKVNKGQ